MHARCLALCLSLCLLLACRPEAAGPEPTSADPTDSGADGDPDPRDTADSAEVFLSLALAEAAPSVVRLTWTGPLAAEPAPVVSWSSGALSGQRAVEAEAGEALVVGLEAASEAWISLEGVDEGGQPVFLEEAIETGPLPSGLVPTSLRAHDETRAWGGFVLTSLVVEPTFAVLLDPHGHIVWWHANPDFSRSLRARAAADGSGVWMANLNQTPEEPYLLRKVGWDGELLEEHVVESGHHDFDLHPDGSLATLASDPRVVDGEELSGDTIVHVHTDGSQEVVFNAWDHWSFDPADLEGGTVAEGHGWPHANALSYVAEEAAWLVSLLQPRAVALVDRATGGPRWVVGGRLSTLADEDGGTDFFEAIHGSSLQGDRLLVFVNESSGEGPPEVVELTLDPAAGLATRSWSYTPATPVSSPVLGDVHRLDNGHVLATFAAAGLMEEVTPEGEVVWSVGTDLGGVFGYTQPLATVPVSP